MLVSMPGFVFVDKGGVEEADIAGAVAFSVIMDVSPIGLILVIFALPVLLDCEGVNDTGGVVVLENVEGLDVGTGFVVVSLIV